MKYLNTQYKIFESEINDIIEKCKKYKIEKYDIDDDGLLTVYGNVDLERLNLNKMPLGFKEVYGYFCISISNIMSLKGSPEIIHGDFYFYNTLIKNLKYCPKEIYGNVYGHNSILKQFIEFPKYIGKGLYLYDCYLISLYGCNDHMHGNFIIDKNKSLKSLRYGPKHVDGSYDCSNCGLTSLYGAPKHVGDWFNCSNNKLTSLKHSPKYIGGDMFFRYNNIKSFEYFPEYVGGVVYCDYTPVYEIWKLFKDKNYIEYLNQMKIIKGDTVNIKKLNVFLKSINKEPVENVKGFVNIHIT